ncbi:hypothetical protein O181_039575 [Austropuccinia psidii MF-1]|uniref:Uncharacterized protein n=1 Tax=Austropuccinia psidii MF-1 TaxID=1389203 RepID=A0A9Q3DBS0_9BASI|nr:hypothetical protein [Austropuccinia psidii MF-1]
MDQGEPSLLNIPDPQIIEGGGTEGEYSVSSVSLELISKIMEEKWSIQSVMHIRPEGHQGSGDITSFMAPSRSSIWGSKTVLGPNQKPQTSP